MSTQTGNHMFQSRKGEFSLPPEDHYLNCAYMAPLSKRVQAAGEAGIRRSAVPARIRTEDFFTGCERVRRLFARLINAPDPARVAIIPAASYGLAIAARNTRLCKGQNVVTVHQQFPSNVHIWRRRCASTQAHFRAVHPPVNGPGHTRTWNEAILESIDSDTAVVALDTVHWTDGIRFDLARIAERAREVGAAVVLDGTQSVGALPFDLGMQPDALVCAAYKWLTGPYSIGAAYFGPRYDQGEPLEETWLGREGSGDFSGLVDQEDRYLPGAARFDVGESANFVLVPMLAAALEQVLEWGVSEIQSYCRELLLGLVDGTAIGDSWAADLDGRVGHLLGLQAPDGVDPLALAARLKDQRVFVSARGRAIRVSPHVYNDESDILALRKVLEDTGVLKGST